MRGQRRGKRIQGKGKRRMEGEKNPTVRMQQVA